MPFRVPERRLEFYEVNDVLKVGQRQDFLLREKQDGDRNPHQNVKVAFQKHHVQDPGAEGDRKGI